MTTTTPFLPGLEDVQAPPGLSGWDYAFWRTTRLPGKQIVLAALRAMAGSRPDCCPTNETIRAKIVELGHDAPTDRGLTLHLRQLELDHGLIRRCHDGRAKSRRRIAFTFLADAPRRVPSMGASRRHPWAQVVDTHGRKSSTPMGASDQRPSDPVVIDPPIVASAPVSPLNSNSIEEREETLTLCSGEEIPGPQAEAPTDPRGPIPGTARAVFARLAQRIAQAEEKQAAAPPVVAPVPVPVAPAPPVVVHVETVDMLARLANPCGPEAVEEAARRVADRLDDGHSIGFHRLVCAAVRDRKLPAKTAVAGFKQATSGTASSPARVYNAFLKEHGPPGWAHKATPGPTRQKFPGGRSR